MKENHRGELLFHAERACKSRMYVVLMALMEIYWNRNYCVDFLDDMISYCGREDNILACNQMMLLSSVEFAAVARLWSIFQLAVIMLMRWLDGKTHKLAHRKWGYISIGKVMYNLKKALQSIVNTPDLIHDQYFMMGMLTVWEEDLPEFKEYRHDVIEKNRTGYFNDTAKKKEFPLKEFLKELFTLVDQDNKHTTPILDNLAVVGAGRWIE